MVKERGKVNMIYSAGSLHFIEKSKGINSQLLSILTKESSIGHLLRSIRGSGAVRLYTAPEANDGVDCQEMT